MRNILTAALREKSPVAADIASSIRAKFAPFGGVELELPPRDPHAPHAPHRDRFIGIRDGLMESVWPILARGWDH